LPSDITCSITASPIPHRPHTFFIETQLRRPSKDGITLVVAGDYTNTGSQYTHITGLKLGADIASMTLKFSTMPLANKLPRSVLVYASDLVQ